MARIILHIGPEKCGSTSIQTAMAQVASAYHGLLLDPYLIIGLDREDPDPNVSATIRDQIEMRLASHPEKALIVSHEMIFKSHHMLTGIAKICAELTDDIRAIAYVRRQSDFALSGFGQWHFRTPERLAEARDTLENHKIDPAFFQGTERHLMAGLLGGWTVFRQPSGHLYFNWNDSADVCRSALEPYGVSLSIGVLPREGFSGSLVGDFMERAGLPTPNSAPSDTQNPGFSTAMIEATVNAIDAGFEMPGPHEANDFYRRRDPVMDLAPPLSPFLTQLKAFVDQAFWDDNQTFSQAYNHPSRYFAPDMSVTDQELMDVIHQELERRENTGRDQFVQAAERRALRIRDTWNAHKGRQDTSR